jgi:hypothetical protein
VDVDEHPFIATGAMMARHGLLPYRDYHYNHMPTQVIIYSLLFRLTDHLLLIARLFQDVCAAGLAALLAAVAHHAVRHRSAIFRRLFVGGIVTAFVAHPLFTRTAGLSWNHDLATFACVAGLVVLAYGASRRYSFAWALLAGALAGLSVTSRLTYAPAMLAYGLLPLLHPDLRPRQRVGMLVGLSVGFLIAASPALWVLLQSPRNAYFGNFLYPKLNTAYHLRWDRHARFKLIPIILYYLQLWFTLPGNGIVTIAFALLMGATLQLRRVLLDRFHCLLFIVLVAVVCLIGGSFVPAPPFEQYFYPPVPFMILGITLCLAAREGLEQERHLQWLFAFGLAITVGFALPQYRGMAQLFSVNRWTPIRTHALGVELAAHTQPGKILTLEMVYPVEGGRDIYERLATSRFGLRTAPFLSAADREQYLMPLPAELDALFVTDPPQGYYVQASADPGLERVMEADALRHGYRETTLPSGARLWLPPGDPQVK